MNIHVQFGLYAELYERLSKKGKPEKVIKVAIAHKLVRQIFGVIKNGSTFSLLPFQVFLF
jgi:hypothetical protein